MKLRLIAAAAALAALAAGAKAEIVTVTFTGTVYEGDDPLGLFGTPGASLDGDSVTAVYTVNTGLGDLGTDDATYSELYGGAAYGLPSPASEVITISDDSVSNNGAYYSYAGTIYNWAAVDGNGIGMGQEDYNTSVNIQSGDYIYSSNPVTTGYQINSPTYYPVQQGDETNGYLQYLVAATGVLTYVYWNENSVTIADGSSVPEPATWALMLTGLAAAGGALRRRRTYAAA